MAKDGFKLSKKHSCGRRMWVRKGVVYCDFCDESRPSPARAKRRANGQQP
jgi:hypothetical protein